jgi:serine/threonine protein kinase
MADQIEDKTIITLSCPACKRYFNAGEEICPQCQKKLVPPQAVKEKLLRPGEEFQDRFEIISVLGQGGMGVVYKAKQKYLNHLVAIKTLLTTDVNDRSFLRFQQEARATCAITHKNVATVHDFGLHDGQPYLVMDFIDGTSLSALLFHHGAMPAERAVYVFRQVADAMESAHQKGVLHRDLKPGNIMLTSDPVEGDDFVKVVDFGIAKLLHEEHDKPQELTRSGEVFGSPHYMSPEQCTGHQLDARSDIYSLGCVMYEALTGKVPFAGENTVETMYSQMKETQKSFEEVRPDVYIDKEFEAIIAKCLKKNADERYASMAQLRDALDDLSLVIGTRRPHRLPPAFKAKSKNLLVRARTSLILLLSLIVSVTAFYVAYLAYLGWEEHQISVNFLEKAAEAETQKNIEGADRKYQMAVNKAEQLWAGNGVLASVLDRYGMFKQRHHQYNEAVKLLERALQVRLSFPIKHNELIADNYYLLGVQYENLPGRQADAERCFKEALARYEIMKGETPGFYDDCLDAEAKLLEARDPAQAAVLHKRAEEVRALPQ